MMKDKTIYDYSNDDNTIKLNEWCRKKHGRISNLARKMWPNQKYPKANMTAFLNGTRQITYVAYCRITSSMLLVEADEKVATSLPPKKTAREKREFENSPNNVQLRTWCNEARGRAKALGLALYPNSKNPSSNLTLYISGGTRISEELMSKIKSAMIHVELHESVSVQKDKDTAKQAAAKQKVTSIVSTGITSEIRRGIVSKWINDGNSKAKRRLANVIYEYNFGKTSTPNFARKRFSYLMTADRIVVQNWNRMQAVMDKVDKMIKENHQFAIAAAK